MYPTTGAEENLLGYPGTRYYGEHIFVHEFSHAIMGGGIRDVDPTMYAEIRTAYEEASGRPLPGDFEFYIVFSLFRWAAILSGVYRRALEGNAADARGLDAGTKQRM